MSLTKQRVNLAPCKGNADLGTSSGLSNTQLKSSQLLSKNAAPALQHSTLGKSATTSMYQSSLSTKSSLNSTLLKRTLPSGSLLSSQTQLKRGTTRSNVNPLLASNLNLGGNLSSSASFTTTPLVGLKLTNDNLLSGSSLNKSHLQSSNAFSSPLSNLSSAHATPLQSSNLASSFNRKRKGVVAEGKSQCVKKKLATVKLVDDFEVPHYEFHDEDYVYDEDDQINSGQEEVFPEPSLGIVDTISLKRTFINAISSSLVHSPDFKNQHDVTRVCLVILAEQVMTYDPEFILKVALYTRSELNIRTTANFLLAFSSYNKPCRPHLGKYFSASVRLPSDWIDVAEQYQIFDDRSIGYGALPSTLRKAMTAKFADFDEYQLAKYNKESSVKKKQKKQKLEKTNAGENKFQKQISSMTDQSENEEEICRLSFSIKQLIKKIHIAKPVNHVMCLIGKRYPATLDEFYKLRLEGVWDETRAGKRMKLPTPETWETQLSLKGNKKETWHTLLDHKKLPYMAMLRNLRNMIQAGIDEKYHVMVIKKLTDQGNVIHSRQFPFRFFSAYEVLKTMDDNFTENQTAIIDAAVIATSNLPKVPDSSRGGRGRGGRGARGGTRGGARGGRGGGRGGIKLPKGGAYHRLPDGRSAYSLAPAELLYDKQITARYRTALDVALKIATVHNVSPIRGTTYVYCNVGMSGKCMGAKSLGRPGIDLRDVGLLLGMMCIYACEKSEMIMYARNYAKNMELERGTILHNLDRVKEFLSISDANLDDEEESIDHFPLDSLDQLLLERKQIDNIVILSNKNLIVKNISKWLNQYRQLVNKDVLFVNIALDQSASGMISADQPGHKNDVHIAGFSDQILRFIAERSDAGQVTHVEKIDLKYNLKATAAKCSKTAKVVSTVNRPLPIKLPTPRWQSVRIFISSTFLDMHGERDLLTRFIFPELRARAKQMFINLIDVDLRWGVTEEETRKNKAVQVCLEEVQSCDIFIGLLGSRYGSIPSQSAIPESEEFQWIHEYDNKNASVTELEMHLAMSKENAQQRTFFYFRDNSFQQNIPKNMVNNFVESNSLANDNLKKLKATIKSKGFEIYDSYPCSWGGITNGYPMVSNLTSFGQRVINNVCNILPKLAETQSDDMNEGDYITMQQQSYQNTLCKQFVGRQKLLKQCRQYVHDPSCSVIVLSGKSGSGKSSLMAATLDGCTPGDVKVVQHYVGAAGGATNVAVMLQRLCTEVAHTYVSGQHEIAHDYVDLVEQFSEILNEYSALDTEPLVIAIDGLDQLTDEHQAHTLNWLPNAPPKNVTFLLTTTQNTPTSRSLAHTRATVITVGSLELLDKAQVVRSLLAVHGKKLDESAFNNQMKLLTSKSEAVVPLYLSLACEELKLFALYEEMTPMLRSLPQTLPLLLQTILQRLESDIDLNMITDTMCLLLCSRNGLLEEDLHSILSLKMSLAHQNIAITVGNVHKYKAVSAENMIPAIMFAQILRGVNCFVQQTLKNHCTLKLSGGAIKEAIKTRYISKKIGVDTLKEYHLLLAGYYLSDAKLDNIWRRSRVKSYAELPYHLACGRCYVDLKETLCDLSFLEIKASLGLVTNILQDFDLNDVPLHKGDKSFNEYKSSTKVAEYRRFISGNLHIIKSNPLMLIQQALNESLCSVPTTDAQHLLREPLDMSLSKKAGLTFIELLNKSAGSDPCTMTIDTSANTIRCVALSKEGDTILCGSDDCVLTLYNLNDGKELMTFTGHAAEITDVCFASSNMICSASADCTISVWDVAGGHRLHILKGHSRRISSICCNPVGSILTSVGWDCTLRTWNIVNGKQTYYTTTPRPVNTVAFHPENPNLVIIGSWDSTLSIWDVYYKSRKAVFRGHKSSVRSVSFSPNGRHVASASLCGEVKLWSALNSTQVGNISGHSLPINNLMFSVKDNHQLVTVSDDQKLKIWSGDLGCQIMDFSGSPEEIGHPTSIAISKECEYTAIGYQYGTIKVFDSKTGVMTRTYSQHSGRVGALTFSMTDSFLVSGADDASVLVFHYLEPPGSEAFKIQAHSKAVLSVAIKHQYMISSAEDYQTHVHNGPESYDIISTTSLVTSTSINSTATQFAACCRDGDLLIFNIGVNTPEITIRNCHSDWINACAWSNNSDFVVTASNDQSLKVWDVKDQREKVALSGHKSAVTHVDYKYGCIISGSVDGEVKIWSRKGTEITTLRGHKTAVQGCAMTVTMDQEKEQLESASSSWFTLANEDKWNEEHAKHKVRPCKENIQDMIVATCCAGGNAYLWKPLLSNQLECYSGHGGPVHGLSMSKSGLIATSANDSTVKVWDSSTQSNIVHGHNAGVTVIKATPDMDYVVSGTSSGEMKIWKIKNNMLTDVFTEQGHSHSISGLAVLQHNSGSVLVTTSEDGYIRVWRLVTDPAVKLLKLCEEECSSAITSLALNDVEFKRQHMLAVGHNNGSVTVFNLNVKQLPKQATLKKYSTEACHEDRVTAIKFEEEERFISLSIDGTITYTCLKGIAKDRCKRFFFKKDETAIWFTAIGGEKKGTMYFTNSNGEVAPADDDGVIMPSGVRGNVSKIHNDSITATIMVNTTIYTASMDGSIKIWDNNFRKHGQFNSRYPITSLCGIGKSLLAYGDKLGNVNLLKCW